MLQICLTLMCYWELYCSHHTRVLSHFCSPVECPVPHLRCFNNYRFLGWQNHLVLQLVPRPQTKLIQEDDHGWGTPSFCHPDSETVFEDPLTSHNHSLISSTGFTPAWIWFFLHKGSEITPFPTLGGLTAARSEISVPYSCTESLLAVSSGLLAASVMALHCSEVLTVPVCLFLVPIYFRASLIKHRAWQTLGDLVSGWVSLL